jgi:hypothetical protein
VPVLIPVIAPETHVAMECANQKNKIASEIYNYFDEIMVEVFWSNIHRVFQCAAGMELMERRKRASHT